MITDDDADLLCTGPRCPERLSPTDAHKHLCWRCQAKLGRELASLIEQKTSMSGARLPTLVDELRFTARKQACMGDVNTGGGTHTDEQPLLINESASEALDTLRIALVGWVRGIYRHAMPHRAPLCLWINTADGARQLMTGFREGPQTARASIEALVRWLIKRMTWVVEHPKVGELLRLVTLTVARFWRLIDQPIDRWFAGGCSEENCDGEVYAQPGGTVARCLVCRASYDVAARRTTLLTAAERLQLTAAELSRALPGLMQRPLSPETVRTWCRAGKLSPTSYTEKEGWPKFLAGDVITLALGTPTRQRRNCEETFSAA